MIKKLLIVTVILGGVMAGCFRKSPYALFVAKDAALGVRVAYPQDWFVQERSDKAGGFANVVFVENNPDKVFRAMMVVTAKTVASFKGRSFTAQTLADTLMAKTLKRPDAKVVSQKVVRVAGQPGREVVFSYEAPEKLYVPKYKWIAAKEALVVFQKGDLFYMLRYVNTQEDFSRQKKFFQHALRTLRLVGR